MDFEAAHHHFLVQRRHGNDVMMKYDAENGYYLIDRQKELGANYPGLLKYKAELSEDKTHYTKIYWYMDHEYADGTKADYYMECRDLPNPLDIPKHHIVCKHCNAWSHWTMNEGKKVYIKHLFGDKLCFGSDKPII